MSLDSILRATGKNLANCGEKADWYSPISDLTNLTVSDGVVSLPAVSAGSGMTINKNRVFTNGETFTIHANHTSPTGDVPANQYRYILKPYKNNTVVKDITITGWTYNQYYNAYWSSGTSKSFTLPKDIVNSFEWGLGFLAYGDISAGTLLTYSNIQLEEGSTATTYEPYEYLGPKTIKISSNGENLTPYPYADNDKTENGITFVTGNYSGIRMNGTVSSDLPIGFTIVDNLDLTVGDYTFSSGYNGTVMPNDVVVQLNYLEGTIPKGVATLSGSKLQETFSIDDTLAQKKFRATIVLNAGMSSSFSVNDLLLCPTLIKSGSKEVLKVSYNSRNFFNKSLSIADINVTATAVRQGYKIPVNAGVYTVSGGSNVTFCKTLIGDTYGTYHSLENAVTLTLNTKGYILIYSVGSDPITAIVDTLQLELGNKKTDYVPYFNTVVWTQVLTGYNITSTTNADGTQSLNIVDATSTTDHYNITSTDNSDGTQTLNITDA